MPTAQSDLRRAHDQLMVQLALFESCCVDCGAVTGHQMDAERVRELVAQLVDETPLVGDFDRAKLRGIVDRLEKASGAHEFCRACEPECLCAGDHCGAPAAHRNHDDYHKED